MSVPKHLDKDDSLAEHVLGTITEAPLIKNQSSRPNDFPFEIRVQ